MLGHLARLIRRAALAGALLAAPGANAAGPRLVSLNLCADELALALADPDQIVALSRFASDPELSPVIEAAARFPVVHGTAEEALALAPDLVLAGPYDRPVVDGFLGRGRVAVHLLPLWTGFEQGEAAIRSFAQAIGHAERGERLVAAIEQARAAAAGSGDGRTVLVLGRGGYVDGGASLVGLLAAATGLENIEADRPYGGFVPLERLLTLDPRVLVLAESANGSDRAAAFLRHPALRAWEARRRVVMLPPQLTACGGASLVGALDLLARALRQ